MNSNFLKALCSPSRFPDVRPVFSLMIFFICSNIYAQPVAKKILPDDYPVTTEMLKANHEDRMIGEILTLDNTLWFTNDSIKQVLIFFLATDYHRLYIYHFCYERIPDDLMKQIPLYVQTGLLKNTLEFATIQHKKNSIDKFISSSKKFASDYFVSNKGFKPGDSLQKAIRIYGNPDAKDTSDGLIRFEWEFKGDKGPKDSTITRSYETLADNSYGYKVTMYFSDEKLIAMILLNDVP
jgi:hypothetical protein